MEGLVSLPRTDDYAYRAQGANDLAKDKGTWWATENADSYHLDAMAIYVQQQYRRSVLNRPLQMNIQLTADPAVSSRRSRKMNWKRPILIWRAQ